MPLIPIAGRHTGGTAARSSNPRRLKFRVAMDKQDMETTA